MPPARNSMCKISVNRKSMTFMAYTFHTAYHIGDERAITGGLSYT